MSDRTAQQESDVSDDIVDEGANETYVTDHGLVEAGEHR